MSKHTPGPWNVAKFNRRIVEIGDVIVCSVAGCFDSHLFPSEAQCEANTHLIAAAPDLYEALEIAIMRMENLGCDVESEKAALAKARGEE